MSSTSLAKASTGERCKYEAMQKAEDFYPASTEKWGRIVKQYIDPEGFEALPPFGNHHMYAEEWYLTIPIWGSPEFVQYIISSRELVFGVHYDKMLKIRLNRSQPTASADQEENTIWISPLPFGEEFLRSRGIPQSEWSTMAIAAANGTLLHEAAHFKKSTGRITDMFDKVGGTSGEDMKKSGAAYTFANLIEDVYIEDWLREEYPKYTPFLEASHHLYFSDLEFAKRVDLMFNETEIFRGHDDFRVKIGPFLDLCITMKNWRYDEIWGEFMKPYFELFMEARGKGSRDARADLLRKIWKTAKADKHIIWDEADEDCSLTGIPGSDGKDFDGEGASITVIKVTKEELEEMATEAMRKAEIGSEIGKELEKESLVILIAEGKTDIAKIPPIQVKEVGLYASEKGPDKRFKGLGRLLRQTFTHNYTPGEPQRRGQVLVNTRLYRIATDGKIFSYRERRKATGKDYEICILVDCSGSMRGSKIIEAMSVGVAAYGSLRRARIRTYLLGHTSSRFSGASSDSDESPVLYVFGLPKDPMSRVMRRAARIPMGSGMMFNNYDGFAILKAAEYFSDKPTKKWLFVISDGMPSGRYYGGDQANLHTAQCVKTVRQKGIDVVSITIEEGAYNTNDMIYGPAKNVKTYNTSVLKQLIEAMFTIKKRSSDG